MKFYEVWIYTPYYQEYFVVFGRDEKAVKEWADENFYNCLDEYDTYPFQEYMESDERVNGIDFYSSNIYEDYMESSEWEIKPIKEDLNEYFSDCDKPIFNAGF